MSLSFSAQGTEIFLTHDWANDELGRNNHERVHPTPHTLHPTPTPFTYTLHP